METREIRDRLLREQAKYEQSLEQAKKTVNYISSVISTITEEQITLCRNYGVELSPIANINLDKLYDDANYRDQCRAAVEKVIVDLHKILEDAVCIE